jgi:hypothetical protein
MGKPPRKRRLNPKPRHALELLASNSMGATEAPLLAHGFLDAARNVGGFPTPGNNTAETALAGWGARIRTWE